MAPAVKKTMVASLRYLPPLEHRTPDSAHIFAPPHYAAGVLEFMSAPPPCRLPPPRPCHGAPKFVSYKIYKAYCESSLVTAAGFDGGSASSRLLVAAARVENPVLLLNLHDRG